MKETKKKDDLIKKFLLNFDKMNDEELVTNYAKDRLKILDMMNMEEDEMVVLLIKLETYNTVMNKRKICHD